MILNFLAMLFFGYLLVKTGDADNPIQTNFSILNIDPLSDANDNGTS